MNFPPWIKEAELEQIYRIYYMAKDRCTNRKNKRFMDYGGRGIQFLLPSFKAFVADVGPRPEGFVLDRTDNSKHYELGNLRWVPHYVSCSNRRPQYNSRTKHV